MRPRVVVRSGRSVLVLGGTSEIGLAIAERLVAHGATRVVLAGRNEAALAAASNRVSAPGVEVATAAFDADAIDGHERTLSELIEEQGDVDVVIAAWGILGDQAEAEGDALAAVAVGRTNYLGAVSALTVVANRLRAQGHGSIIVLSSVAAERARRSNYVYGSSKAGLDAFCQGLAIALADASVHLLIVRPGFVATKMTSGMERTPLSTTPDAVADAALRGLMARRDVVWVPGALRLAMAVIRHMPRALFRRLRF